MAVRQFAYVHDLAETSESFALSASEEGAAEVVREAQLAVAGEFVSGRYGRFQITEADIDTMIANFSQQRHPVAPTELSVDYDHREGEAAGWIKGLQKRIRQVGTRRVVELWGTVGWLKDAAEKIAAKKYRFFSPMFDRAFTSPLGQKLGATLTGGALTNRPFLQGMAAITCSLGEGDPASATVPQQRSQTMRPFTTKDKDGNDVVIDLDAIKDSPEIKALSAASAAAPAPAPGDLAATITAAVKAAVDPVAAQVSALQGTVVNLSSTIADNKKQQAKDEAERVIAEGIAAGKVAPAEKENLLKLSAFEGGMEVLRENIAARIPSQVIRLNHQHGSGMVGSDDPTATIGDKTVTLDTAEADYEASLKAFSAKPENLNLSSYDAMAAHDKAHPELAKMFQLSFRRAGRS